MIETSAAYKAAITADARRTLLKAVIDIIDPDITYEVATGSKSVPWSNAEQLHDKVFSSQNHYATLESERWKLDGTGYIIPNNYSVKDQTGYVSYDLCGEDGRFKSEPYIQLNFKNVDILQAFSVYFSTHPQDGVATDFKVEVLQGGTAYFQKEITGNRESNLSFTGFTVYNPDAIRVTVSKWSLPSRRMRVPEILPGVYEEWDADMEAHFDVKQQGDISCLTLPYGTCTLRMDNLNKRFEPRSKDGIFLSIEDRQGIDVSIGTRLSDGTDEYIKIGKYFQYSGGWKTSDNNLTMEWFLVDIVGLLSDREYIPPDILPTTLDGWVQSIVSQLGEGFAEFYKVDPNYSGDSITANSRGDVAGLKCGDILRYVCMASATWPRADSSTGKLTVEPLWSQGNKMDLENLNAYPVIRANNDIAAVVFTLADGNGTQFVVSGNSTASSETKSVQNPFIHTTEQALNAAKNILSTYGGNRLETVGRGNPSSEIGDVDTVELDESSATTGRRIFQTFTFNDGVLQNCQSTLLQADGSFLFEEREIITQSGPWIAPPGAKQLRVIVGNGGQNGTDGTDGTWEAAGLDGVDGIGGKIWSDTININEKQSFDVLIGGPGETTKFGPYSGDNGVVFNPSYTDVASGEAFGRSGVQSPKENTGDGGAKGVGGVKGNQHTETIYETETDPETGDSSRYPITINVIDNYPGKGTSGKKGASGFVVVYWDKEAEA